MFLVRGAIVMAVLAAAGAGVRSSPPPAAPRTIVVVELFTSEGCSSCPPADTLLRQLAADQPIDGVQIVGLGDHVDYWDHLGWRDPFSSALFSERQSEYARAFRSESVYTPQMVVDGTLESSGSDARAVRRNILEAAKAPKAVIDVEAARSGDAAMRVSLRVQVPDQVRRAGTADLAIAVTEDGLTTRVRAGENDGRTLSHGAVVRLMRTLTRVPVKDRVASAVFDGKIDKTWNADRVRLVAILQERASHRIIGAGVASLAPGRK